MKTKMTNTISSLVMTGMLFITGTISAQQSAAIWVKVKQESKVQFTSNNGMIRFNDASVQLSLGSLNITGVAKAVPASRNAELQKVYEITCNCDVNDLMVATTRVPSVFEGVEEGPRYELMNTPNDYTLAFQSDYALNMINANDAWAVTTGDSSVVIAITDANFYLGHEELVGKYNFVSPNYNSNYTHGTAVATTAAGYTNNGLGKASIGYNSSLQLRSMNYNEVLEACYSGAQVINMSWASGCYYSQYQQDIMTEVYNQGVVLIASAGNGSTCNNPAALVYPASYDHVISVSSVGPMDNHERFIGNAASTHQHNPAVDICAPGYDVALTTAPGVYTTGNGTSFAAPYVSGAVALMLSVNKCLTPDDIEYILKATTVKIDELNPQYAGLLGAGRLDAAAAVDMASKFNKLNISVSSYFNCTTGSYVYTLDPAMAVAPYTINWSNGTSAISTELSAGTQWVQVVDSNRCVGYVSFEVATVESLTITAEVIPARCNSEKSGSIDVSITGGFWPYTVIWNDGEQYMDRFDIAAGIYSAQVIDGAGCTIMATFEITQPTALTAVIEDVDIFIAEQGSISLEVNGGVAPYTYSWSNGSSAEDLEGLEAGFYEVYVEDANGCGVSSHTFITEEVIGSTSGKDGAQNTGSTESGQTSGIEEAANETALNVYPNPSEGDVTVTWSGEVNEVLVFAANGQLVQRVNVGANESIQISGLSTGMYTVIGVGREVKFSKKITVL